MKKHAICWGFLAFLLIPATVRAGDGSGWARQLTVGAKVGLDLATHAGPGANDEFFRSSYRLGFTVGGDVELRLSEIMSLQAELAYATKGANFTGTVMPDGTVHMSYIELPVLARASLPIGGRIDCYALLGPALGVALDVDLDLVDGTHADLDSSTKTFDIGLTLGAGAAVEIWERKGAFTFDLRYNHGLLNIDKTAAPEDDDVMNRAFYFTVGYRTNLDTLLGGPSGASTSPLEPSPSPMFSNPPTPARPSDAQPPPELTSPPDESPTHQPDDLQGEGERERRQRP